MEEKKVMFKIVDDVYAKNLLAQNDVIILQKYTFYF